MNQQIADILKHNDFRYLMYRGGAGGEFLTHIISRHSDDYETTEVDKWPLNRWNLRVPSIINALALSRVKTSSEHSLFTQVGEILNQQKIDAAIAELELYLQNKTKKHLFRTHLSLNDYFGQNTYLLTINSQHWFDYCNWLQFVKVGSSRISIDSPDFNTIFYGNNPINNKLLIQTGNLLKERSVEQICLAHLDILRSPYISDLKINEANLKSFLDKPLLELKDEFYSFFFARFDGSSYAKYQKQASVNKKIIFYENIFEPGYINEMFNINSNQFITHLHQWHYDNLKILESMSFDIRDYK